MKGSSPSSLSFQRFLCVLIVTSHNNLKQIIKCVLFFLCGWVDGAWEFDGKGRYKHEHKNYHRSDTDREWVFNNRSGEQWAKPSIQPHSTWSWVAVMWFKYTIEIRRLRKWINMCVCIFKGGTTKPFQTAQKRRLVMLKTHFIHTHTHMISHAHTLHKHTHPVPRVDTQKNIAATSSSRYKVLAAQLNRRLVFGHPRKYCSLSTKEANNSKNIIFSWSAFLWVFILFSCIGSPLSTTIAFSIYVCVSLRGLFLVYRGCLWHRIG